LNLVELIFIGSKYINVMVDFDVSSSFYHSKTVTLDDVSDGSHWIHMRMMASCQVELTVASIRVDEKRGVNLNGLPVLT